MQKSFEEIAQEIRKCHGQDVFIGYSHNSISDEVHHIYVHLKSFDAWGFGDGTDPTMALIRAYYESIERIVFHQSGAPTTNGFAAHVTTAEARVKAAEELIERDVFLTSWFCNRPPVWLSPSVIDTTLRSIDPWVLEAITAMERVGITPRFGVCGLTQGRIIMAGLMLGASNTLTIPFGASVVPGIGSNIAEAIRRLVMDQMRILTGIGVRAEELGKFRSSRVNNKIVVDKTMDHLDFYLDLENFDQLKWYLNDSTSEIPQLPDLDISYEDFSIPLETAFPISVVRAHCPQAQAYFVGAANSERINRSRLGCLGFGDVKEILAPVHPIP